MSSINQHPTFFYQQPEEYHFSHDSVFLARWAAEHLIGRSVQSVLDLCSGCGIIGLDFLYHLDHLEIPKPQRVDFLEIQEVYAPYFESNRASLLALKPQIGHIKSQLFLQNYESTIPEKYDLILSNPPYFFKGQGTLSNSDFKNRCRFFLDSDIEKFLIFLINHLTSDGMAFFLMREQKQHGVDLSLFFSRFQGQALIVKVTEIRGTGLFKLTKLAKPAKT